MLSFIKKIIIFDDNIFKRNIYDILIKRAHLTSFILSLFKLINFINFNKFIKITQIS